MILQEFDAKMVMRQLQTSGVVDAVTVRHTWFSQRALHADFVKRFEPAFTSYFATSEYKEVYDPDLPVFAFSKRRSNIYNTKSQ